MRGGSRRRAAFAAVVLLTAVPAGTLFSSSASALWGQPPGARFQLPWLHASFGPCYGTCAVFEVSVFDDGTLVYWGRDYVKVEGTRTKVVPEAALQELRALLASPQFRALKPKCCNCYETSDAPTVTTELREASGITQNVEHYYGCSKAPAFLRDFEASILTILGTREWTTPDEPFRWRTGYGIGANK